MSCYGGRRSKLKHEVPGILQQTDRELFVRTNQRTEGKIVRTRRARWTAIKILKLLDVHTDSSKALPGHFPRRLYGSYRRAV